MSTDISDIFATGKSSFSDFGERYERVKKEIETDFATLSRKEQITKHWRHIQYFEAKLLGFLSPEMQDHLEGIKLEAEELSKQVHKEEK